MQSATQSALAKLTPCAMSLLAELADLDEKAAPRAHSENEQNILRSAKRGLRALCGLATDELHVDELVQAGGAHVLVQLLRGPSTDTAVSTALTGLALLRPFALLDAGAEVAAVHWLATHAHRHACWMDVCILLARLCQADQVHMAAPGVGTVDVVCRVLQDSSLRSSREVLVQALAALCVTAISEQLAPVLRSELQERWHWNDMAYDGALYKGVALRGGDSNVFLSLLQQLCLRVRFERSAVDVRRAIAAKSFSALRKALPLIATDSVAVMARDAYGGDLTLEARRDRDPFTHQGLCDAVQFAAHVKFAPSGAQPDLCAKLWEPWTAKNWFERTRRVDNSTSTIHALLARAMLAPAPQAQALDALCHALNSSFKPELHAAHVAAANAAVQAALDLVPGLRWAPAALGSMQGVGLM
jgi:hypothetical protein